MQHTPVIVSVGGSLIVPENIDTMFLKNLRNLVVEEVSKGTNFIIIVGGGKTARYYQDAAKEIYALDREDLDWLGIHSTRLNAHLVRTVFRDIAHPVIVTNPDDVLDVPKNTHLVIAAGYRPGASTDLRAIQIAERRGAKNVINLSNIDYVYTADPRKNQNAEKIERITWADFRKLIPEEWDPGLSSPFDPVAAKEAERLSLEVAIMNGAHLNRLSNYLNGKPFVGTIIEK